MFNAELMKAVAPASYALLQDLKAAREKIAELELRNAELDAENEAVWARLHRTRLSHGVVCRGVKAALGLQNWPRMPGLFNRAVGRLVKQHIDGLKAEIERLEYEQRYVQKSDIS